MEDESSPLKPQGIFKENWLGYIFLCVGDITHT